MVLLEQLNSGLWGYFLIYMLLGAGFYFTIRSGFVQFRLLPLATRLLLHSRQHTSKNSITSFEALCTSLAAHIGTSNLAGVAIAISLGGPGAVFWMWVIAILGMSTAFVENTLAQAYKTNNGDGTFRGGPAYYIEKALRKRRLALTFSFLLVITFGFSFNALHANSVAAATQTAFALPAWVMGVFLAVVTALIIFRGIHAIVRFAERVVPFMTLTYLAVALLAVILCYEQIPGIISLVFTSAFGLESAAGGGMGYLTAEAINQGIRRGLLSNEAGMGSGPNVSAISAPIPSHPATQGLISMFSIVIDTLVICTCTAAIVLLSGEYMSAANHSGIVLTQHALSSIVGDWGKPFIATTAVLFGFTSIVANYYYGESSLRHIRNSEQLVFGYRLLVLVMVVWGSMASLPVVWAITDITMGSMAFINLIVITLLSGTTFKLLKDFEIQHQHGLEPRFDRRNIPFLDLTMDQDVWSAAETSVRPLENPDDQPSDIGSSQRTDER